MKKAALLALVVLSLGACRSQPPDPTAGPQSQTPKPLPPPSVAMTADAAPPVDAAVAQVTTADEPMTGAVFDKEVRAAWRVAACAGDDALIPATVDKKTVEAHCTPMKADFDKYKKEWLDVAMPFIAKLRPANLPTTVVYPFGGGDLVTDPRDLPRQPRTSRRSPSRSRAIIRGVIEARRRSASRRISRRSAITSGASS